MTDIEQKAREVVKPHCTESDDHDYPQSECRKCSQMAEEIAAAIQSAVDEERLENRKLFSIGMSDLRREPNYDRICDKVSQIDKAIRARGQAKEKP